MKGVILAAGEGTRLNKGWTVVPKPLLEVGGCTIIEKVINQFKEAGITDLIIVVGFMSEHIKDHLRNGVDHDVNIEYIYNKDYKKNLVTSLALVKEHVQEPFILCMADLYFKSSTISNILSIKDKKHNYVCTDSKLAQVRRIEEKIKIQSKENKLVQASLVLPRYNAIDCAIYFLQPTIFEIIEKCMKEGKKELSLIMTEIAIKDEFRVFDIGKDIVIDIDREQDVEYVKNVKK